jgi:ammonium transporter, Amt family
MVLHSVTHRPPPFPVGFSSVASTVCVNTTISGAAAAISSMLFGIYLDGKAQIGVANNGLLAGLVAVTASCSVVEPEGAFVIGTIAGVLCLGASRLILRMGVDDVVDACAVHLVNGSWGVIAAGLFTAPRRYVHGAPARLCPDCVLS